MIFLIFSHKLENKEEEFCVSGTSKSTNICLLRSGLSNIHLIISCSPRVTLVFTLSMSASAIISPLALRRYDSLTPIPKLSLRLSLENKTHPPPFCMGKNMAARDVETCVLENRGEALRSVVCPSAAFSSVFPLMTRYVSARDASIPRGRKKRSLTNS